MSKEPKEQPTDWQMGFNAGVIWAVARLVEMHDQPTMAAGIYRESQADPRHAAEYDLVILRKTGDFPRLARGIDYERPAKKSGSRSEGRG